MISVFTALHPPAMPYLSEAYASLVQQTCTNWEWVICCNGGASVPMALAGDERVRVMTVDGGQALAKATACHYSRGEVLVKLDADDMLARDALATVAHTREFAYGNFAPFADCTWDARTYGRRYGWHHRHMVYHTLQGSHRAIEHRSWTPGPLMVAGLVHAPCCLMAWDRETYRKIGGYDLDSKISPEHELLCRTYLACGAGGMEWHDKCLSFYRHHSNNTSIANNGEVTTKRLATYEQYAPQLFGRWCADERLLTLPLDTSWDHVVAGNDTVGLVTIDKMTPPWDELHRVMVGGAMLIVRHKVQAGDRRFQRVFESETATHCVCLKQPYSDRPVGEVKI